jgi:hypothetical protein
MLQVASEISFPGLRMPFGSSVRLIAHYIQRLAMFRLRVSHIAQADTVLAGAGAFHFKRTINKMCVYFASFGKLLLV